MAGMGQAKAVEPGMFTVAFGTAGLSHLLISKLADLSVAQKHAMIDRTLDVVGAGVVTS